VCQWHTLGTGRIGPGPKGERPNFTSNPVIQLGFRVNSKRGVQFRQWATGILRDYLTKGYALNQTRLSKQTLKEARQTIDLLSRTLTVNPLLTDKDRAVLDVENRYTKAWRLLLEYDGGVAGIPLNDPFGSLKTNRPGQ